MTEPREPTDQLGIGATDMTDRTHPEALRLADELERDLCEYPCEAVALVLRRLHARIAELEAQLEAIRAGGVSGPLMGKPQEMPGWMQYDERNDVLTIHGKRYAAGMFGADGFLSPPGTWLRVCVGAEDCVTLTRAPLVASAGGEPVAWVDERALSWLANSRSLSATITTKLEKGKSFERPTPLYLHPSPPEGMVGGWMPIETAPKYTEHGVSQHLLLGYAPDEIHEDGFVSQGYWMEAEEDAPDNMGHDGGWVDVHFDFFRCGRSFGAEAYRSAGTQPTHWMPLPPPPTSAEGVEHG